jgi:hypothetical protein
MEKLVRNLVRLAAAPISGALLTLVALSASGCGESTTTADLSSPEVKQSLNRKYPELANPPAVKVKARGRR